MTVYRLRVTVLPRSPYFTGESPVWRDIEVEDAHTLEDLHGAIFEAFDRVDDHLYDFTLYGADDVAERTYVHPSTYDGGPSWPPVAPEEVDRLIEHTAPEDASDAAKERFREVHEDPPPEGNVAETTVADLDLTEDGRLTYLFDYGDNWDHTVEVRAIREGSLDGDPVVVERRGESPPQYPDEDELGRRG